MKNYKAYTNIYKTYRKPIKKIKPIQTYIKPMKNYKTYKNLYTTYIKPINNL